MEIQTIRVKINDEWTTLTKNADTGYYEAELTAPKRLSINRSGGYYPIEIEVTNNTETVITINDEDPVFGGNLRVYVDRLYTIYDRTQADADRANELNEKYLNRTITEEEMQEWNHSSKGALNLLDINRNENNCKILGEFLAEIVSTKEWERGQIPNVSDYARILANVEKIKGGYNFPSIPPVPEQPLNTYQKWNDIEKILHEVYRIYIGIKNSYYYCGTEIFVGEGIGLI